MIDEAKQVALTMMDVIARELNELEAKQRELRLEYWRHQAIAYPAYECHHPDTHFCKHCIEEARATHD